jgi:hypothetical protein
LKQEFFFLVCATLNVERHQSQGITFFLRSASGLVRMRMEYLNGEQSGYTKKLVHLSEIGFGITIFFFSMDRYVAHGLPLLLGEGPWPYLAGANLTGDNLDHKGIFFSRQDHFQN